MVGEAGDAEALLSLVAAYAPDVALVDIKLPPTHTDEGLRAAVRIRQEHPSTAALLLSSYLDVRYASDLLETGAGPAATCSRSGSPTPTSSRTPCAG